MRAMWRLSASPAVRSPAWSGKPYTLKDLRDRLAEVSGERAFADEFFDKYVEGRETPDYAKLLAPAGLTVRRRGAGIGWLGAVNRRVGQDHGARAVGLARLRRRPGKRRCDHDRGRRSVCGRRAEGKEAGRPEASFGIKRESGRTATLTATLGEDP